MARKSARWAAFEPDGKALDFGAQTLKKHWPRLHAGDCEPFPDAKRAQGMLASVRNPPKGHDAASLAAALQDAWRAFHEGDFQAAYEQGKALGVLGASVACKAMVIHADYLVDDADEQLARYETAAKLAEDAVQSLPHEPNSHYRLAHALGRYSQGISIAKALKMGLAGKVRQSLDTTLQAAPKHAEAHTAMAVYHAEIIDKVGSMLGGLTYGAKAADAQAHIDKALKLTPGAPIVHVEHANIVLLLKGSKGEDAAADAYEAATRCTPMDAMEQLDARYAAAQIE